ncbi:hypothetical protein D9M68_886160 [compost metagenome]
MYSYEDRMRAVALYIKPGKRAKAAIRQLGYPSKNALKGWAWNMSTILICVQDLHPEPLSSHRRRRKRLLSTTVVRMIVVFLQQCAPWAIPVVQR